MKNMKWIDPSRPKKVIIRCEFCKANVSEPYKGVHDETELILGIPVKCRNNGRMNADIAWPELAKMHKQPVDGIKWFVEHKETRLWWTGYQWTNNPDDAFACDLEATADRYARLQRIENYMTTEHEFIDRLQNT